MQNDHIKRTHLLPIVMPQPSNNRRHNAHGMLWINFVETSLVSSTTESKANAGLSGMLQWRECRVACKRWSAHDRYWHRETARGSKNRRLRRHLVNGCNTSTTVLAPSITKATELKRMSDPSSFLTKLGVTEPVISVWRWVLATKSRAACRLK